VLHPQLKEIVTGLEVKRGLLALVTSENESGTLKATAEGKQIVVETETGGETDGAVEAGIQAGQQGCGGGSPAAIRRGSFCFFGNGGIVMSTLESMLK